MSRYIDADALITELEKWSDNGDSISIGVLLAMSITDEQPTVDAVEVVRCKDCKHADDFCDYGERRDGEEDE